MGSVTFLSNLKVTLPTSYSPSALYFSHDPNGPPHPLLAWVLIPKAGIDPGSGVP